LQRVLFATLICGIAGASPSMASQSDGSAQAPTITIYAGPSLPVIGQPAFNQDIGSPDGVTPNFRGGLYFLSYDKVWEITSDGVLGGIAGTTSGFSGDGGPALTAQMDSPTDSAIDSAGNLYIADAADHRIRKVTRDGLITTVAGNGSRDFSGDGG